MGKLLYLFLLSLCACKKNDTTVYPTADLNSTLNLNVEEAKSLFKAYEKKGLASKNDATPEPLFNPTPDWSRPLFTTDQKSFVIEVPIRFDKPIGYNLHSSESIKKAPANTKTSLVVLKDKETGYMRFVLMHLSASIGIDLQKINYGNRSEFSGIVAFTTMNGSFLNGWIYDKGNIKSLIRKKDESAASRMELPEDCTTIQIDWYEQTCTTYPNNTEICSGWVYTHTSYYTVCTSDGSGGGAGEGGACDVQAQAFFNSGKKMNEKISVTLTGTTGALRTKEYKWKIYGVSNGLIPMYLVSKEQSSQSTTGNNVWKFDSFTHVDISEVGTSILYGVSTSNISATSTIFSSATVNDYAKMHLSFTVKLSLICDGLPAVYYDSESTNQTWHVNE